MKWYEQNFINRRDWILDNVGLLGLDGNQALIVLLIDFMNDKNIPITTAILEKKSGLSSEEVERCISVLCAKKYLEIRANAKEVSFLLNGLFEANVAQEENVLDSSLFSLFEGEFKRPLSNKEMTKISEWNKTFDKTMIIYALREASAYNHLSLTYIDKILSAWQEKHYTVADLEAGKR